MNNKFKFLHLSDIHLYGSHDGLPAKSLVAKGCETSNESFIRAMRIIRGKHPDLDFIIISGDLSHDGTVESYRLLKTVIDENCDFPVYLCLGNHDCFQNFKKVFLCGGNVNKRIYEDNPYYKDDSCDEDSLYYEVIMNDYGLRLITIDSNSKQAGMGIGEIPSRQLDWLSQTISGYDSLNTIIMLHHPPFIGDDIDNLSYQLKNSQELYNIIRNSNVSAVFSGHTHKNSSYLFGKVPAYVADSTGFSMDFTRNSVICTNRCGYNFVAATPGGLSVTHYPIHVKEILSDEKTFFELYGWLDNGFEH